jgi:nicotinamide-nucleotide amidase
MKVEVLNTGTELLLGRVLNTHLPFLAEALFPLGLRIERQTTVPDGSAIRVALEESFARAEIVLITGGLGPTTDDITREIVAELLGLTLEHDEEIMKAIAARFASRKMKMSPRVALQAQRPREATVLWNDFGTAPGLYLPAMPQPRMSPHLFLLPGPPRELIPMFQQKVLPILRKIAPRGNFALRSYRIAGLGESIVEERVGEELLALGVELGYCARPGEVDVRVIGAPEVLDRAEAVIVEKLGSAVASQDGRSLEKVIIDLLSARGETIVTAESCTGGFIANELTNVPGASAVFLEGFVTYANAAKVRALAVDADLIEKHGAVSREVAAAMAEGARRAADSDYALATTGVAGPSGGSEEKPVGTVFIALASRSGSTIVERHRFATDRATFKDLTARTALDLLRRNILASTR